MNRSHSRCPEYGALLVSLWMLCGIACFTATAAEPAAPREHVRGIWLMGQSLCEGSEALPLVTPEDTGHGNYAFQRGVRTWIDRDHSAAPEERAEEQFAFAPLRAQVFGGLGETIANGLADHLSTHGGFGGGHFLVAYAGQGGRMIGELGPRNESADPRTPAVKQNPGGFYLTSLDDARRAVRQAEARGADFSIPALVWMQGEANGGPTGGIVPARWETEIPRPAGQARYSDQLIAYRRQWSHDLCAITGQSGEIPMFTYQTLGPAGEAQLMAAEADPNIVMVGPHYAAASAINSRRAGAYGAGIHLSADAQRWYGEQVAKVMRRVLAEREHWQPLQPRAARLEADRGSMVADFIVPRPPLVLDEQFLPRQQSELGAGFAWLCGFQVRTASAGIVALSAVELVSPTRLRLRFLQPAPAGTPCFLSYGSSYAGRIGTVSEIRPGPVTDGQPTTELVLAEQFPARTLPLLDEGAFTVANSQPGSAYAQAPIRAVREESGHAVLHYENRERRNGVDFAAGQPLTALRPFIYGNLRDSDSEAATFTFADSSYGRRAGQPYPLWNWCVEFSRFPISEP